LTKFFLVMGGLPCPSLNQCLSVRRLCWQGGQEESEQSDLMVVCEARTQPTPPAQRAAAQTTSCPTATRPSRRRNPDNGARG
jgi:hypothetical protein